MKVLIQESPAGKRTVAFHDFKIILSGSECPHRAGHVDETFPILMTEIFFSSMEDNGKFCIHILKYLDVVNQAV